MNESINLEYLPLFSTYKSQVMTYTDSLVYISFPIGEFSKFLNFEFNKQINIPLTKDLKLNEDHLYLKTKIRIPDQEEFIGYCYQMKKYNNYNINIETLDQDLFQNSYNGFKNVFYDKMYETILGVCKDELIETKPKELFFAISDLIKFYEAREEYEKCHKLNQVGYEIYNTIID